MYGDRRGDEPTRHGALPDIDPPSFSGAVPPYRAIHLLTPNIEQRKMFGVARLGIASTVEREPDTRSTEL